jgi:rhamnopyranosyl-N-acetylglucosaminyl-diphospho-decaprenol beta-1,3/1,4-galactofuranosyltransferase
VDAPIAAVVVTWNRAFLVERVLRAIDRGRARPDEVVVVDNASTDDTPALLDRLAGELDTPLRVVRLPRNTGGAGGFKAGLTAALEGDARLFWLMDDDGQPTPDCLATLLRHTEDHDFLGPAVVAEDDPHRLCFPIRLPGTARVVHDLADVERAASDGVLEDVVIPLWSGSGCRARSSSSGATTWSTSGGPAGPAPGWPRSSGACSCTRRPTTSARR